MHLAVMFGTESYVQLALTEKSYDKKNPNTFYVLLLVPVCYDEVVVLSLEYEGQILFYANII